MKRETFDDAIGYLTRFHGRAITAEAGDQMWTEFKDLHDEIFCEAARMGYEKLAPGNFPTIERMRGYIAAAREKLWQKQKDDESREPISRPRLPKAGREYARESFAAIRAILIEHKDPIEVMEDMEARWPGRGWGEEAKKRKAESKKRSEPAVGIERSVPAGDVKGET